ncbi:hypothetical protein F441_06298 [Phytophthora nicotianae CJ01A1]|nr:hypothetical protein PPTG_02411 [Phytophthora nicotianae INRA-310]ETI47091.1 hypothetical protein F443_08624 [Phytophthora nicotianae P1569]ETK95013.1 hypothetical protein L915_02031 [Phytophthora nicotianae]ETP19845.1 hypothetical protein F441_06298 [Phytophthora nicotianae CJ01A1]ETL24294.1 hypothetical protein L916_21693 [Phytophthora nicotianae]ETN22487.1 hypothetical protein PPTG_02411 [Phytophthora nicotianae INRA-310]
MNEFYNVCAKYEHWFDDMTWLLSIKTADMLDTPELFEEETDSDQLLPSEVGAKYEELAKDTTNILRSTCLASEFRLTSGGCSIKENNMMGSLVRDRMLNDLIIDFCIRDISSTLDGCYAMSSFAPPMGCPKPPKTRISTFHYVVLPVHLSGFY